MMLRDEASLGQYIFSRYAKPGDSLFRFEALPAYSVASDGGDFERWKAGAGEPNWERKRPVLEAMEREQTAGMISQRVRLFSEQLTAYERYSATFGYFYNAQFEDIRVLRHGEHQVPELLEQDYWVINGQDVVLMHYTPVGEFIGADVLQPHEAAPYLADQAAAWAVAEPFLGWWQRHPELQRRMAA